MTLSGLPLADREAARLQTPCHSAFVFSTAQLCRNAPSASAGFSEPNAGSASHFSLSRRPRAVSGGAGIAGSESVGNMGATGQIWQTSQAGHFGGETGSGAGGGVAQPARSTHRARKVFCMKEAGITREFWTGTGVGVIVPGVYQPLATAIWRSLDGVGIFASFPGVRRGCVYRVVDFPQEKKTRRATGERPATLNRSLVKYPGHGQGELRDSRLEFGTVFCGHLIRTTHGADHRGQR